MRFCEMEHKIWGNFPVLALGKFVQNLTLAICIVVHMHKCVVWVSSRDDRCEISMLVYNIHTGRTRGHLHYFSSCLNFVLLNVHGKQLGSCRDGQFLNHTVLGHFFFYFDVGKEYSSRNIMRYLCLMDDNSVVFITTCCKSVRHLY